MMYRLGVSFCVHSVLTFLASFVDDQDILIANNIKPRETKSSLQIARKNLKTHFVVDHSQSINGGGYPITHKNDNLIRKDLLLLIEVKNGLFVNPSKQCQYDDQQNIKKNAVLKDAVSLNNSNIYPDNFNVRTEYISFRLS